MTLTALADARPVYQIQELKFISLSRPPWWQPILFGYNRCKNLPFLVHIPKSSVTCSCEATECHYTWHPPLLLQQEYKSTSELDFARAESWKNKQTGKVPLTRCIPIPGFSLAQAASRSHWQSSRVKGMAQAAQSLLPSWGMFAMSPEMMHTPRLLHGSAPELFDPRWLWP